MNQASTALQQELLAACSQLEEMARTVQGKEDLLKSKDAMMVAQQAKAAAEIEGLQCRIQENEGLLAEKGAAGDARGAPHVARPCIATAVVGIGACLRARALTLAEASLCCTALHMHALRTPRRGASGCCSPGQ